MKSRVKLIVLSAVALPFLCLFCSWANRQASAPMPKASLPGGYYEEAFFLKLEAPSNGTVYFTTDGSTPTKSSQVYEQPLFIQNRSQEPNIYNSVQNIVYDWKHYSPSASPVKKGTVLRAVFINDLGISSEVMNQTYFVGLEQPTSGCTLSLIFEPDLLFGENGIYVTGKEYDSWYLSGSTAEPPLPNFEKDLEAEAFAQLIADGQFLMDQRIGLKMQGNTSRAEIKKRFSLYSREAYSGSHYFDSPIFGSVSTHSAMLKYYLPDAIAAELLFDRAVALQKSIPVRVFLNGEFLYDTYMLERYDSTYFKQYYQVSQYQLLKNGVPDPDSVDNPELPPYEEFMFWVRNTDFSEPEQWEQIQKETDIQSYIDWMVANYFFCNIDFRDDHNQILWRSSFPGSGPWEDTRWRWCVYDVDAISWVENDPSRGEAATVNVFSNSMGKDMHHTSLYSALRRNPEFCKQFVLTFMDMLNNNFSPDTVNAVLAKYGNGLEKYYRYFNERPAYAVAHLAEEFQLTGNPETLQVTSAQSDMGTVTVNTSTVDLSDGHWEGCYFSDYPVTLTAVPREGFRFVGWRGSVESTLQSITVDMTGSVLLEAIFAEV